jgi:hypothetical protein
MMGLHSRVSGFLHSSVNHLPQGEKSTFGRYDSLGKYAIAGMIR